MLHLAQVKQKDFSGKAELQLLAYQKSEYAWALHSTEESTLLVEISDYSEGSLVLVELTALGQVNYLQDATSWVVELIEQYLSCGLTPTDLQQEEQRAEQWRQSLTLQSQELGRRALEMEARRDQLQDAEETLKREKAELQDWQEMLEREKQQLQDAEAALSRDRAQLQDQQVMLDRERQQLELKSAELDLRAAELRTSSNHGS
jgi:DNA repair exonuclease SbcCD ATPase subunit